MKNILITVLIIGAVLIGGFYALNGYIYNEKQADPDEMCIEVLTDARNPKTGEVETFPTPCHVPEGWDIVERDYEAFTKNGENWTRYANDDLGVRFEYRVEPEGYTLVDQLPHIQNEEVVAAVSLFNTKEYMELLASSVPREGPTYISLTVFENASGDDVHEWVDANPWYSNVELAMGDIEEFEFAGNPAVRYTTDGLYTNDYVIALNNGRIYVFNGTYTSIEDDIYNDFGQVLESVSLY